jgi:hypothetical protein
VGPAGQGVWLAGHPLGPLVSDLCTLPLREVHSRADTYFVGILIFFVIS